MLTVIVSDRSSGVVLVVIGLPDSWAAAGQNLQEGQETRRNHIFLLISYSPVARCGRLSPRSVSRSQFSLDQFADGVDQRAVRFLPSCGTRIGNVDVNVHG